MADTRDLKSLVRKNMRVRAPPPVPRRSKVRFAPTSFCAYGKKDVIRPLPCSSFPNRTRCAGLRFGIGRKPGSLGIYTFATFSKTASRSFCRGAASKAAAPIWLRCSAPEQSPLCSDVFLCQRKKRRHPPLPCSSFPNRTRCTGLRFGIGRKPGSLGIYTVATFSKTTSRSFCRGAASKAAAPIWLRCSAPEQSPLCSGAFLYLWHKDVLRLLPCSSSPNHKR